MLTLPCNTEGRQSVIDPQVQNIIVIGANGAGKSRFVDAIANQMGDRAFRISALEAIYGLRRHTAVPSIDTIFENSGIATKADNDSTQFERLLSLLMHDEMLNLIGYKLAVADQPDAKLQTTRLDKVIALWQSVFPGNRVLVESGKFLFTRGVSRDTYSALRLSDGERAILFYAGALQYAPEGSTIIVDAPEIFLHPSITQSLWNRLLQLRPDCKFVFATHDLEFTAGFTNAQVIWVQDYNPEHQSWQYVVLPINSGLTDDMYRAIIGTRKPLMFIEGDGVHSIDSKLYPLIFRDYSVKSLGSCNKVIEATRTFNDLNSFHHMDSMGIVDRDRRCQKEVDYLRGKRIMVPDVAEIENIFMLEDIVRTVAVVCKKKPDRVFAKVKKSIMGQFNHDLKQQALQHTRHQVKQLVEYRVDGRFASISQLEEHMDQLKREINPRGLYENFCKEFRRYVKDDDYRSVLRVYNQKSMIAGSNVAALCGLQSKEQYIGKVLQILQHDSPQADIIRQAVMTCFELDHLDNASSDFAQSAAWNSIRPGME